jgi:OOP family OmpA-OmpF porin
MNTHMKQLMSIVFVVTLVLAAEGAKAVFILGTPTNLGPTVNRSGWEHCPTISADGLTFFFDSQVPGGEGHAANDLMVTRRPTLDADWGNTENLGHVYSGHYASDLSADGSTLYFASERPGGSGGNDIWQMPILPH